MKEVRYSDWIRLVVFHPVSQTSEIATKPLNVNDSDALIQAAVTHVAVAHPELIRYIEQISESEAKALGLKVRKH